MVVLPAPSLNSTGYMFEPTVTFTVPVNLLDAVISSVMESP